MIKAKKNKLGLWICSGGHASHFHESETACKCGCDYNDVDQETLDKMEIIRLRINKAIIVDSWCRCPEHNKNVGGAPSSGHLFGLATDFHCNKMQLSQLWLFCHELKSGFNGLGTYPEHNIPKIHADMILRFQRWTLRGGKYRYLF